jgi:hypothetical protein
MSPASAPEQPMTRLEIAAAAAVACALLSPEAGAHHSGAMYDVTRVVTIDGEVVRLEWRNPHVYLYVSETAPGGERDQWEIEGLPTTVMQRLGWSAATLRPGDRVTVKGNPARNSARRALYPTLIEQGQRVLYEQSDSTTRLSSRGGSTAGAAARGFEGNWETLLQMDLVLSLFVPRVALTPAGTAAVATFDGATMNPWLECVPNSAPLLMIDPDVKRIDVRADAVLIHAASGMAERVIHLNASGHDGASASLQGHSIGRFEGDTLVIDTALFLDHRTGNGYAGIPSGSGKQLIERLTRAADGRSLTYRFELRDPEFLAEPVTGEVVWGYRPDLAFSPVQCSVDVARRGRG